MIGKSCDACVYCWLKISINQMHRRFFFIDGVLGQWAVDLMGLWSGFFWPLTLLCWWNGQRVVNIQQINIRAVALQALSEVNGVVKEKCPLEQGWISGAGGFRVLSLDVYRSAVSFSLSQSTNAKFPLICLSFAIGAPLSQVGPLPPPHLFFSLN